MHADPDDFLLSSYRYELPPERIAQHPPAQRGASRLLVLDKGSGQLRHSDFARLPDHLPPRALLVLNASRVVAARLSGVRANGGKVECVLLTPLPLAPENPQETENDQHQAEIPCLLRSSKKIRQGETLAFGALKLTVLEHGPYGQARALLAWQGSLSRHLAREGHIPLPPYIRRQASPEDAERYQTVYAREEGSVAAPTAGLHFTHELLRELLARHFELAEIHLHVGYGTFSPVRCEDIRQHPMHREHCVISPESAEAIRRAQAEGRPVIAVGTTSARALEGCAAACGAITPFQGWTDIFLYPGFTFRVLDGMITNFHTPESSLLMLVAAFAGRGRILDAYAEAIRQEYRFFSYGDAMLII